MPTNPATNGVSGRSYTSAGVPDLLDPARFNDRDAVAHRQRLLLVVGDEHEGDAGLALDLLELDLHLLAQLEVERAERLVEQQHRRPVHQRAGERDALALAAGQLAGLALAVVAETDPVQRLGRARRRSALPTFLTLSPYSTFSPTLMCGKSA